MKHLKIFGKEIIDDNSINQLKNCLGEEDLGVLTADAHYGYGHPIGGAVAYKDRISLSGVGFDIACGNKAVRTNVLASDLDTAKVMDEIFKQIGFGVGRVNREKVDHPVLDKIAHADFDPIRDLAQMASEQLGTVGSGNHFVDLFEDEQGYVWVGVHFGSRGFGHKITTGFIAMSQGKTFQEKGKEGGMDAKPILFDTNTDLGQAYTYCLGLGGEYAYAGRNWVVNKVLEILQAESTFEVHNHHNFAWEEEHFGEKYWVVRKGCTPAFPGQLGFIGANMYDTSVIIEGIDSADSKEGLYSTVHGAGRVMSRNAAAGKKKWVKGPDGKRRPIIVKPGAVNFVEVQQRMQEKGIELRGGGADEAPQCYKKLEDVIAYQGDTIRVLHKLNPIGVAMAGSEVFDPYKD